MARFTINPIIPLLMFLFILAYFRYSERPHKSKAEIATATCAKHGTLAFTVSELGYIAKALDCRAARKV